MSEDVKQTQETPSTPDAKGEVKTNAEEESQKTHDPIPYPRFQQVIAERNILQDKMDEFEKTQNDAKENELKEQSKFKELYETEKEKTTNLENSFKTYKITNSLKVEAMKQGIIDIDGISFIKPDSVKFDDKGNPENVEELVKELKKTKSYLFKVTENKQEQPFKPDNFQPASNTTSNAPQTREEYYRQNPDKIFGAKSI